MDIIATTGGPFPVLVPEEYRGHELVAGRVFYTLPIRLLDLLVKECGRTAFDPGALRMEVVLSEQLQHNYHLAGYTATGEAFAYHLLAQDTWADWNPTEEILQTAKIPRADFEKVRTGAPKEFELFEVALRGYVGWLVTNPQYLEERDALFDTWTDMIAAEGIPLSGSTMFGEVAHSELIQPVSDNRVVKFLKAFEQFYARWRLQHLVTKELPEPLSPQSPVVTPLALLTHMKTGGVTLYQPDTMPVPGRDRLRKALDTVRLHQDNDHLAAWIKVSRLSRPSDSAMTAFRRIFIQHHYWTALEQRHPQIFRGNVGRIQNAFAEYLYVSPDSVDKYRQRIRSRLAGK